MIPKRLHQIWLGGTLPEAFQDYKSQLLKLNPSFEHYQWGENDLLEIGFDCAVASQRFPTLAGVSNAARLYILRKYGGFYFDHDFLPLKPLESLAYRGSALACEQGDGRICNAFLAATPHHEWIAKQCDLVPKYERLAAWWGVELATLVPREGLTILPQETCFPYRWDDPAEKRHPHPETYMCHLWDMSWVPKSS